MLRPRSRERGFVLIGAIWLLILCGSIAAILMLRSIQAAREVAAGGEELKREATLEAAAETVFASILMDGPSGRWAMLPANGTVKVNGEAIAVTLSSEAGRLDLNEYPLEKLDDVLRGLDVGASARGRIVEALTARREAREPLQSIEEMRAMLAAAGVGAGDAACLESELTIFSGFAEPREGQISARLARAMAKQVGGGSPQPAGGASAMRLEVKARDGQRLATIARVTGLVGDPVSIMNSAADAQCDARRL